MSAVTGGAWSCKLLELGCKLEHFLKIVDAAKAISKDQYSKSMVGVNPEYNEEFHKRQKRIMSGRRFVIYYPGAAFALMEKLSKR